MPQLFKLSPSIFRLEALSLAKKRLVGHFTGIFPSLKAMDQWMQKNWMTRIKSKVSYYVCGRWYYAYLFKLKEDKYLIFRNGP